MPHLGVNSEEENGCALVGGGGSLGRGLKWVPGGRRGHLANLGSPTYE
jgi:hypothetical protein